MKSSATGLCLCALLFSSTGAQAASDRMDDGKLAYEKACASCHESPASEAPQTRSPQDWVNRSHLWDAVLAEHASKGYLKMPAKGGTDGLSDYDTRAAAEYMLTITHPELPRD
jgi:cytochrome c5